MADVNVTVIGHVGNDPQLMKSKSDLAWTHFSVSSNKSSRDAETGQWIDSPTLWFKVKAWGSKAENVAETVRKGTPVVVTGRLSAEPYMVTKFGENGEPITEYRTGLTIENATIAVDLSRGTARYLRTQRDLPEPNDAPRFLRAGASIDTMDLSGSMEGALDGALGGALDGSIEGELERELDRELVAA